MENFHHDGSRKAASSEVARRTLLRLGAIVFITRLRSPISAGPQIADPHCPEDDVFPCSNGSLGDGDYYCGKAGTGGYYFQDHDCAPDPDHSPDVDCGKLAGIGGGAWADNSCNRQSTDEDCGKGTQISPAHSAYQDNDCTVGGSDADCNKKGVSGGHGDSDCAPGSGTTDSDDGCGTVDLIHDDPDLPDDPECLQSDPG